MGQLAWLLATMPTGDANASEEALRLATRAAELTGRRDVNVLDSLAAAYAALGRMPEAVTTAETAETLARTSDPTMVEQIRARLALYRQNQRVQR